MNSPRQPAAPNQQGQQSQKRRARQLEAREVADYLKEHPNFLARHPGVLSAIEVPAKAAVGTVSLIERQVAVLRNKNKDSEQQLRELMAVARNNEKLQKRMGVLAVDCAGARALEHILVMLPGKLKREFKLEAVTVCADACEVEEADDKHWFALNHLHYSRVRNRVERGNSVCLKDLHAELLSFLFAERAEHIGSCALVPLIAPDRSLRGLLALGGKDPERFDNNMGTVYLDFLGCAAGSALHRLTRT